MTLVLARHLEDPATLLAELQDGWRRGALVGLALPQERAALQEAVLGSAEGDRSGDAQAHGYPFVQDGPGRSRSVEDTAWNSALKGITASQASRQGPPCDQASGDTAPRIQSPHPLGGIDPGEGPSRQHHDAADLRKTAMHRGPGVVLGSGGSSGGRRWCLQPLEHLWASADACGLWLAQQGLDPAACLHLNALPLQHVSGLMPLLRTERWRSELRWLPPQLMRRPADLAAAAPLPRGRPVLLSLVPTQLHRLLQHPEAVRWLTGCSVIWVGGAALAADLAERARGAGLPLAPCYGATETAAMVCALSPQRFLAGEGGCGAPLADVELRLEGAAGAIAVRSARISPGWFEAGRLQPFRAADGWWRSGDAGAWSAAGTSSGTLSASWSGVAAGAVRPAVRPPDGMPPDSAVEQGAAARSASLMIRGRLDGALHSGGETIFPEQVRQRLLTLIQATDLPVAELLLLAETDPEWGERLVALVRWQIPEKAGAMLPETDRLQRLAALARALPPPQRPRRWLPCPSLQTDVAGKWERRRWREWLQRAGSGDGTSGPVL